MSPLKGYAWLMVCAAVFGRAGEAVSLERPGPTFEQDIRPLLKKYCYDCHNDKKQKGDLNLAAFGSVKAIQRGRGTWLKTWERLLTREMPPEDEPQPTLDERQALADWIEKTINDIDCDGPKDPGRVVIRRLTKYEYRRTVRDLTGVDFAPAADFPSDDVGYGFDNIGDVLSLPPLLMEKYLDAAERVMAEAKLETTGEPVEAVQRFASRAFRRSVTREEAERYAKLVEGAGDVKTALTAVLVSPHFLFRVEGLEEAPGSVVPLNDYELASRLSYFLWSSMPDERLFALAAAGKLRDESVLDAQVKRMLEDPKAAALAESFATQWLAVGRLANVTPDPAKFPAFTPELREAMLAEVVATFDAVRREDRDILELVDADYIYVNEALAKHYGLTGVTGPQLRRVALNDRRRGGVVTSAAVLTATSNPTRTNPTRRGKWVMESILGTPPPPPVPDVGNLEDVAPADANLNVRQRLERHRSDPNCAGCHSRMDPIGFALERYDGIGAWRESDAGKPIDDSGTLPGGRSFAGAVGFKDLLRSRREDFARALAEKLLTYALGRGLEYDDVCAVREITRRLAAENYRFSALVAEIVRSYPFRNRRGAGFVAEPTE